MRDWRSVIKWGLRCNNREQRWVSRSETVDLKMSNKVKKSNQARDWERVIKRRNKENKKNGELSSFVNNGSKKE